MCAAVVGPRLLGLTLLVTVHSLRRLESVSIGAHQLVPDDDDSAEVWAEVNVVGDGQAAPAVRLSDRLHRSESYRRLFCDLGFGLKTIIRLALFGFHSTQQFAGELFSLFEIVFLRYFGSNLPPGLYQLRAVGHTFTSAKIGMLDATRHIMTRENLIRCPRPGKPATAVPIRASVFGSGTVVPWDITPPGK
jgi:hypothetical protein